jgi:polyadenylation factor subunit 2
MCLSTAASPPPLPTPRPNALPFPPPHHTPTTQVHDLRMKRDLHVYKHPGRDITCAAWHPLHEELFASGSADGSLHYWLTGHQVGPGGARASGAAAAELPGALPGGHAR